MRTFFVACLLLGGAGIPADQSAPAQTTFDRWSVLDPGGRVVPYLGRESLYLERGIALMPDVRFGDGTIEFDVAIHGQAGFAGVLFRGETPEDYELIYLRAHRSRQWDALQYTPVFGGQEAWQLYTGQGYNGVAELPANRWVHVRLIVDGYTASVFVDDVSSPQLVVTELKRPWARGRVGLWGRAGAANFSNVKVVPLDRAAPLRKPAPAADSGLIRSWLLSQAFDATTVAMDRLPDMARWERIETEPTGILNIARYRRKVARMERDVRESGRDVVFARATLQVSRSQRVRLTFGYSDDVTVLLDGATLFEGKAGYLHRDGSYLGTLTLGSDTLFLDLSAGRHDLVFAVAERFGGWGIAAKLEQASGVSVE